MARRCAHRPSARTTRDDQRTGRENRPPDRAGRTGVRASSLPPAHRHLSAGVPVSLPGLASVVQKCFIDPHPFHRQPNAINTNDGGRGVYWDDPNGTILEIITRPYGRGGQARPASHSGGGRPIGSRISATLPGGLIASGVRLASTMLALRPSESVHGAMEGQPDLLTRQGSTSVQRYP